MTDKTLAERPLYEEIRDAFDGDDVVAKNIALKKAALALDAKDAAIARLREALEQCPPDRPQMSGTEHRNAVYNWWRLWARPALADHEGNRK